jgi:hypothetical protein
MQRYEIFSVVPNFSPPIGAIFSTNLPNLNEPYFRALKSVIFEPLKLLFVTDGVIFVDSGMTDDK